MSTYCIETKGGPYCFDADNRFEALRKFFLGIKEGSVQLSDVGLVVTITEQGEEYPFRTLPVLYFMGIFDKEKAMKLAKKVSRKIKEADLEKLAMSDAKTLGLIKDNSSI